VSEERIRLSPEATPQEAEAVRRALEALGLIEPAPPEPPALAPDRLEDAMTRAGNAIRSLVVRSPAA